MEGYEAQICALACYYAGVEELPALPQTLKAAVADYRAGDRVMSAMRLALAFPAPPPNRDMYRKLYMASALLQKGFLQPGDLRGLLISGEDLAKAGFNPDQPRVPAGHSDGGQWTSGDNSGVSSVGHVANKPAPKEILHHQHDVPKNALKLTAGDGTPFYAPPEADFVYVYNTGANHPLSIEAAEHYIFQFGVFDFQREGTTFIRSYTNASNYGAGVYMAGAGLSRLETYILAQYYAFRHSSNFGSKEQSAWWMRGWDDATHRRGACSHIPDSTIQDFMDFRNDSPFAPY